MSTRRLPTLSPMTRTPRDPISEYEWFIRRARRREIRWRIAGALLLIGSVVVTCTVAYAAVLLILGVRP